MQGDNNQVTSVDGTMISRKRKFLEDSAETSTPESHDIRSSEPGQLDAATLTKSTTLSHDGHGTCTPGSLEETPQNVHAPLLEPPIPKQNSFPAKVSVKSGHTQEYHDWWQQAQSNTRLFGARLVGDVHKPSLVSSMSLTDLAFCRWSVWSQRAYSTCAAKHLRCKQMVLLRVAKLADHLGLAKLCEAATEALVQLPWKDCMSDLAEVAEMPVYKLNLEKKRQLLHHAKRGAFAEIQVLELLEHTGTPETDIAQILQIANLQPQELHVLVRILSHADRTPGPLLAKAVQQHVTPLLLRKEIDWNTCTRFSEDILQTPAWKRDWENEYELPKTDLSLVFQSKIRNGKTLDVQPCRLKQMTSIRDVCMYAGECSTGLYLKRRLGDCLMDVVHSYTFFEVHASTPYLRYYDFINTDDIAGMRTGKGGALGFGNYLSDMVARHPTSYHGPCTVGVCWKKS